jgi:hypothetical protein
MATTTNYGWTTPDDTALVKDGAAAIRTLGSSVDTTTKALNPSTTLGDIEYRSSTANTNTRLGIGTTGQVLTVSGGVPAWATATSGGLTLISETTASALSTLSLSSIPSTYKQLMLVWSGIQLSGVSGFDIRLNTDSGSNYKSAIFLARNNTLNTNTSSGTSFAQNSYQVFGYGNTSADLHKSGQGYLIIDDYVSTTKLKKCFGSYSYFDVLNDERIYGELNVIYNSTSAISSIEIVRITGTDTFSNIANTSIRLYGIS